MYLNAIQVSFSVEFYMIGEIRNFVNIQFEKYSFHLQVMEKAESDALKVMIFMIEGILPENYFSSNLRGKFLKNEK